jgi:hypothetical protein
MTVPRRIRTAVLCASALAAGLIGSTVATAPAHAADVTPYACDEVGTHYRTFNKTNIHIPTGVDWKSGPGGTVTSSIEKNQSATVGVSIGATVSTSAVVASAEATFSIDASVTSSRTESYTYSNNIAAGKYGHLQFGNWGWRMSLEKYTYNSSCVLTEDVTGTVTKMPSANRWGFRFWETTS